MDKENPFSRTDPPVLALTLWPNRSMTYRGVVTIMGLAAAGFALPLAGLAGTKAAWGMLPFLVSVLLLLAWAIRRNFRDGRLQEELRLWPDLITVERREPGGMVRRWHANPHWVQLVLHEQARIEKYLTLKGNGREIELGAFLSPDERVTLYTEVRRALDDIRSHNASAPTGD